MPDRPALEDKEIEITPEMIEAGVAALRSEIGPGDDLRSVCPEFDLEAVVSVFRAMTTAAPR